MNITVSGNQDDDGGNLAIKFMYFTGSYYNRRVPSIVINNSRIVGGIGQWGGGLRVWSITALKSGKCKPFEHCILILHISNTQFVWNHAKDGGGALYISHYQTKHVDCITRKVFLENCTFSIVIRSHYLERGSYGGH